jgi:decaprenyl-phosphate phosphoribosyltransferase
VADYVKLARPRQWLKNLLVAAAPFAAGTLADPTTLRGISLGFVAFCLASSAMYAFNDAADADADRLHPVKANRPVASGRLTRSSAIRFGFGLGIAGFAVATATLSLAFVAILAVYVMSSLLYTFRFRSVPVMDILVIAFGFLLRALAGGAIAEVALSPWFMAVTVGGATFVSAGRRLSELRKSETAGSHRPVLDAYGETSIVRIVFGSGAFIAASYLGWAVAVAAPVNANAWSIVSCVPFLIGLVRYGWLIISGRAERPEIAATTDPVLLAAGAAWLTTLVLTIYS